MIFCVKCSRGAGASPRSRTVDSRVVEKSGGRTIRRRRECLGCGLRWSTEEVLYKRKPRKKFPQTVSR